MREDGRDGYGEERVEEKKQGKGLQGKGKKGRKGEKRTRSQFDVPDFCSVTLVLRLSLNNYLISKSIRRQKLICGIEMCTLHCTYKVELSIPYHRRPDQ
jgi:hypothetical protein